MIVTELTEGSMKYRFVLNGRTLEASQWDFGKNEVDGTTRTPQWVVVWMREI